MYFCMHAPYMHLSCHANCCGSYLVTHERQAGELLEACQGAEPCCVAAAQQCIQLHCKADVGQVGQVVSRISQGLAHLGQLLDREPCSKEI
jgi:hypothetical protein